MNSTLTLQPSTRFRMGLVLGLSLLLWLPSAVSQAPALARSASAIRHAAICHCPHCPGEATCCCSLVESEACPIP